MTELSPELQAAGRELTAAYARRLERRRRNRRRVRGAAAGLALFCAFTAAAFGSGIADDLYLDPTKWQVFERGSVEGGRAVYVKAHSREGRGDSTFILEHDRDMDRYQAFVLHERAVTAGGGGETGALCTPAELTRAEHVALDAVERSFAPGTRPEMMRDTTERALRNEFRGGVCRGLEYAGERARFVYAGVEPRTMLMPGAR